MTTKHEKQKRQFWVILIIVFLGFVGISMPYLIFPSLFLNPSYSILPPEWGESSRAILLGITLAVYPLGQFLGSPILGSLSDDYDRKSVLTWSLFITAVCNLLTGFAIEGQQLTMLILSRFIAGVMEGNIAIARAMAADITSISKHDSFGKINAAASIAYLIGPLFGGILTDKSLINNITAATPFYLICIIFFALGVLTMLVLEKPKSEPPITTQSFWERLNFMKRMRELFSNKRLRFLMITSTCFTLAVDIFYEFGPVYLTVKWDFEPSQLVLYNGVLCIALAVGNGWLPNIVSSRILNRLTVIYSITGFSFFLIGIILTNSPWIMLLLFGLSGLVIGLAVTMITVKISNAVPDDIQGEVMGSQISLRVLGDAVICLFGGALLLVSSKLILIVAAFLSIAAMGYFTLK